MDPKQGTASPPTSLPSMATYPFVKFSPGAPWKMTGCSWEKTNLSLLDQSITRSSSRTPSNSPILAKGSTATTCQTMSVSTTSLIPTPGCATYSSWVRSDQTGFCFKNILL